MNVCLFVMLSLATTALRSWPSLAGYSEACNLDPYSDLFKPPSNVQTVSTSYNPRTVDWKGFMDAIDCLGTREHRVCTFLIRMFFHDAGAVDTSKSPPSGSDASVVINNSEAMLPPSTQHGEAPMDRYVLGKLAAKFGMSFADGLSVAAAQCTLTLKSTINIPQYCSTAGFPLKVGKLDNDKVNISSVAGTLPDGFDTADTWLVYWRKYLNGKIPNAAWQFKVEEAVALMGSHILLDNHVCSRGAGGDYRNHRWTNGYFRDTMSGQLQCYQSGKTHGYSIATNGFTGSVTSACDFDTSGFGRRTQNAEHEARKLQVQAGIFCDDTCQNPRKLDTRWLPDSTRDVCYGDPICQPCGLLDTRPFCKGLLGFLFEPHAIGQAFWPYTVNDCFLASAARDPVNYCKNTLLGCPTLTARTAEPYPGFYTDLTTVQTAYRNYKFSQDLWFQTYAIGHCKLNNVAARYSATGGIDLMALLPAGTTQGKCSAASADVLVVVNDILADPPCDVPSPATPSSPPPLYKYQTVPCARVGYNYVGLYFSRTESVPAGVAYVPYCQARLMVLMKAPPLLLSGVPNTAFATPASCVFKRVAFGLVQGPTDGQFGTLIIGDPAGAKYCDVTLF